MLSFVSKILSNKTARLQMNVDYRTNQLESLQISTINQLKKKDAVISGLLQSRSRMMYGVHALVNQLDADVRNIDKMYQPVPPVYHRK